MWQILQLLFETCKKICHSWGILNFGVALMKNLRLLREEREETQLNAAGTLGMQQSTFQKYEAGDQGEKVIADLIKFADHYGVSLDFLVGRTAVRDAALDEDIQLAYRIRRLHNPRLQKILLNLLDEMERTEKK